MDEKIRRAMGHPRFPASSAFQNRNVTYRQNYLMKLNFPTIAEIKELLSGGHVSRCPGHGTVPPAYLLLKPRHGTTPPPTPHLNSP